MPQAGNNGTNSNGTYSNESKSDYLEEKKSHLKFHAAVSNRSHVLLRAGP